MLEWSDAALRILEFSRAGPRDTTPRQRLINAFDVCESEAWVRVVLALDEAKVHQLTVPHAWRSDRDNQLHYVRQAAEHLTRIYAIPSVQPAAVALGLVFTSDTIVDGAATAVSEAFGWYAMDDLDQAGREVRSAFLESEPVGNDDDEPEFDFRPSRRGWRVDRTVQAASLTIRGIAALLLIAMGAADGAWWIGLFGLAGLMTTQHQVAGECELSTESRPWTLPFAFPWLLWLAFGLGISGFSVAASILAVSWGLVRCCAHVAEYAYASSVTVHGAPELGELRTMLRRAACHPPNTRAVESTGTMAFMAAAACAGWWLGYSPKLLVIYAILAGIVIERWAAPTGRWYMGTVLGGLIGGLIGGLDPTGLVIVAVAGTMGAIWRRRYADPRLPDLLANLPIPRDLQSARKALQRGAGGLAIILSGNETPRDAAFAIAALGHLIDGRPGQARSSISRIQTDRYQAVKQYVGLESDIQLGAVPEISGESREMDGDLAWFHRLAILRAQIELMPVNEMAAMEFVPRLVRPSNVVPAMEAYLLIAERGEGKAATLASGAALALSRFSMRHLRARERARGYKAYFEREMARQPRLIALSTRAVVCACMAGFMPDHILSSEETRQMMAGTLTESELALHSNEVADELLRRNSVVTDQVISLRLQAVASLNVVRHTLLDADDRALWWRRFDRTLGDLLLELDECRDWRVMAEAIEVARLQIAPGAEDAAPVAPAVRGVSRTGECRYRVGNRPRVVHLEEGIRRTTGQGTAWWSTLVQSGRLFWAYVPEDLGLPATGGSMPMDDIEPLLAELHQQIPVPLDGESDAQVDQRMAQSLLDGRRSTGPERYLARRLGALLPPDWRGKNIQENCRTRLAMSMAPELARVPWPWVLVGAQRFVELADAVMVPPLSLLPVSFNPGESRPVSVAVVNPTGDLPEADYLFELLPEKTRVVGSSEIDPKKELSIALKQANPQSTLLLACHTYAEGNAVSLLLRGGDEATQQTLSVSDLISTERAFPLPRQILAIACESADLHHVVRGEWNVLGPSLLKAGACVVLVTSYPIPDDAEMDEALFSGVDLGMPLQDILSQVQLERLERWRLGDLTASPLEWAAFQLMGSVASAPIGDLKAEKFWVEEDLIRSLDAIARPGRPEIGLEELMGALYLHGNLEGLPTWRRLRIWWRFVDHRALPLPFPILARLISKPTDEERGSKRISGELLDIIKEAAELARARGLPTVQLNHVFAVALGSDSASSVAMRRLSGLDPRNNFVLEQFFDDSRDRKFSTGRVEATWLGDMEIERLYEAIRVPRPLGPDRWSYAERF